MNNIRGIYKHANRWEARFKVGVDEKTGRAKYRSVYAQSRDEVIAKRNAILGELFEVSKVAASGQMNLLILGAGMLGRDVYDIAASLRVFKRISFLDDAAVGDDIIGKCSDLFKFRDEYPLAFIAIGDNSLRKKYAALLREYHFLIPSIVSPAANISPGAVLGDGVVILPMARVGEASIGDFSIIASNGVVSSGARVGSFSHIDCGAIVQQRAHVKESTWVRSGEIYGDKL